MPSGCTHTDQLTGVPKLVLAHQTTADRDDLRLPCAIERHPGVDVRLDDVTTTQIVRLIKDLLNNSALTLAEDGDALA